jgi:CRP-like cAMP-binding protein
MADAELGLLVRSMKHHRRVAAGDSVVGEQDSGKRSTVLLAGVAALQSRLEDGRRRIYSFRYAGDFCDLARYVLATPDDAAGVQAITDCSIAIVDYADIDILLSRSPTFALALWRATMLEAMVSQHRLWTASNAAALERVANLLCEQLALREAIGISSPILPLTQIDIADAAGLSVVHVNRVIQTLRGRDILSNGNHRLEVIDKQRLAQVAKFDGHYLNMPDLLANWVVQVTESLGPGDALERSRAGSRALKNRSARGARQNAPSSAPAFRTVRTR